MKAILAKNYLHIDMLVFMLYIWSILSTLLLSDLGLDLLAFMKLSILIIVYGICRWFITPKTLLHLIVGFGLIQSFSALFQIINTPFQSYGQITGLFSNSGHLGGYQSVAFISAIALLHTSEKHNVKIYLTSASIPIFISLVLSGSRAALLAVLCGLIQSYWNKIHEIVQSRKSLIGMTVSFIMIFLFCLYTIRPDSAIARLLIWRVSSDIFMDHALTGIGFGNFRFEYMPYQSDYFSTHSDSPFRMLADNVMFPFNEVVRVAVELGIIGLLLVSLVIYAIYRDNNSNQFLGPLTTLCVFSLFSYPTDIPALAILFPGLTACLYNGRSFLGSKLQIVIATFMIAFTSALSIISFTYKRIIDKDIKILSHGYDMKAWDELSTAFRYFHSDPRLNAACLFLIDKYKIPVDNEIRCLILPNCENWCTIGILYMQQSDFASAEKYLIEASNMVPTRIRPDYCLWELYKKIGNNEKAVEIAKYAVSKSLKIENTYTLRVKKELEQYLENDI